MPHLPHGMHMPHGIHIPHGHIDLHMKFATGHAASDIVHVNTGAWRLKAMQHLLYGPPLQILATFFTSYILTVVLFALVYLAFGSECYVLDADGVEFGFPAALYISSHVFSTVSCHTARTHLLPLPAATACCRLPPLATTSDEVTNYEPNYPDGLIK